MNISSVVYAVCIIRLLWIWLNYKIISQLTRLSEFPCTMTSGKLGLRLCDSTVKNTFGNERRENVHTDKNHRTPQRLMDLLLMNTIFFASLRIISAHRRDAGCDQNEEETLISLTTLTKVYDPYQKRPRGRRLPCSWKITIWHLVC